MDIPTLKLADYVERLGVKIAVISRETGIPDGILRRSLCTKERDMRAGEFLRVCRFLEKSPSDFEGDMPDMASTHQETAQ